MKQAIKFSVSRPSFQSIMLHIIRLIFANIVAVYRTKIKGLSIVKVYRMQLRAAYKMAAWMDRHPVITGVVCYGMVAILTLQIFVGFMDAWCGIE